ncbi:SubName: Full=Uncharacterized protein {ECO:0000313/EMBL:CCA67536.1} [Serendipita indica DSM 11827]|nr:SubName: Full=Uncharacterized protein {ECO:0000313/EMBL:CCA67536.1} [Serendipita indica DSM 11827]
MDATPKLTSAMMQGGGVYDSIINQTQTPRANEKVLMFLDRIAPSDPVDNVVVWTDDEEPADPRLHMFAPEHRRKGFKQSSVSEENEQILDELAHSEMSYPLDEHNRGSGPRKPAGLENFGSRGWTPLNQHVPMSPPENQYAMPAARPAGAHSRQGSRVPSRMEQRRPPSTRPTPPNNGPSALEIDIRPPSVDARSADGHGIRSLAATDEDIYAAGGYTTPRVKSPPPAPNPYARRVEGHVPPLRSPFKTPQGLAASVALPAHPANRAASAAGVSRPGSRMVVRGEDSSAHKHSRAPDAPLTAAAYETPWFHRTQYGKHDPPTVVSTLKLKLISPPLDSKDVNPPRVSTPEQHVRTPSSAAKTPVVNTVTLNTGHGRGGVIETAPADEHVLSHVHELVDDEPDVVVVREEVHAAPEPEPAESIGHIDDDADIGHHIQEHYDVVDKETIRSTTPKARPDALVLRDYPETEIVDVEGMNERQLVEMLRTPAMRSEAIDYSEEVQRALDLHHDEDLCVLLQAAEDELQHPVVRKAVRKAIAGRLRKLGLNEDYDTVKRTPSMAAKLHKQAFGDPRDIVTARLPDEAPEWARLLSDHVQELTRQFQAANMGKSQPRQIKGREEEEDDDSLHPEHAADEHGLSYQPDHLNIEPPAAGLISPGERLYDEEVYKLRKRNAHASPRSHATWEIEEEEGPAGEDLPTKGTRGGHRRQDSNSQTGGNVTSPGDQEGGDWVAKYSTEADQPPPWLKVNQRLLNWAVIWPYTELENALKSCDRGEQVDEVALTIWTSQIYKRYVRAQMTQYPPATVDKMFVPPNIADAINNAAYNGRHEEVSVMLRELWTPFGFRGHPKLILALTRHRREDNHWVVHRFSLPDASIITYDTYLEKSLPDGRPLGWWFGIRMAFANDAYPAPDQVVQRMIRLHRPLQLQVDNSVAAAAIWRNLIMGSKADRLVDLERLRDLIRQEVKGIRQKKEQGKLSLSLSRSGNGVWPSASGIIEA